jgi:hypothetical protein
MSDMDSIIRRASGRAPATAEPAWDEQGRFAGGLADGAGRDASRETERDENEVMNRIIRASAGRVPWPTTRAPNGLVIPA